MSNLRNEKVENFKLSILRTQLSNTRTFLSHLTASIALAITGFGFVKFFEGSAIFDFCAVVLYTASIFVLVIGAISYIKTRAIIREENRFADEL